MIYGGTIGRTQGEIKLKKPPIKAIPSDIANDDSMRSILNIVNFGG